MSGPIWQPSWDDEVRDLLHEVEAKPSCANQQAHCEKDLREFQRASRRMLDLLATVEPKKIESLHGALYRDQVRDSLWISLVSEGIVPRRIWELVEKTGRVLTPEEVRAAALQLLGPGPRSAEKSPEKRGLGRRVTSPTTTWNATLRARWRKRRSWPPWRSPTVVSRLRGLGSRDGKLR